MANEIEQVHSTGIVTVKDDQSWRFGEQPHGTLDVTLDLTKFNVSDNKKLQKYITGYGPKAQTVYIKSGLPLGRITDTGLYGPYDKDALDGRNAVAGLLESQLTVNVVLSGWELADGDNAALRYRGDIIKKNLPVVPENNATWNGEFYDIDEETGKATRLGAAAGAGAAGPKGDAGASVKAIKLTVDASSGKVTGGTATLTDNSTINITVS
nr:MAG TPA: HEAD DECORATION PROTEIN [Caudoviricetes sp.]